MAKVTLKNITKTYKGGEVIAAKDVGLKIKDGEFFTLLGPSGCGKSTILHTIAGLLKPDKGKVWIGDELVTSGKEIKKLPKERDVSMVFQSYAIYPHMTVFDNIAFPLKIKGKEKEEIERRVKEAADSLNISGLLDRKPKELSGGQRQRVALGRAIVRKPKVFLMDEPLANLDARLRITERGRLKKLQKEVGITTVYVTHNQKEATTMSDRIAIERKGKIHQVGTPDEIYGEPIDLFVASFIGDNPINTFEGKIREENGDLIVDMGVFTCEVPERISKAVRESGVKEVILGIRPEHIKLEKGEGALKGEVTVLEPSGREIIVHCKIGEKKIRVISDSKKDLETGKEIWLTFQKEKIYLFNKKTEKAIR